MLEIYSIKDMEINLLRGMSFTFSILSYLQGEPVCRSCNTFLNVFESLQDKFIDLEKAVNKNRDIPREIKKLLTGIYAVFAELKIPDNPVRQKDAGNCRLPSEFCFAKSALSFYEKIEKTMYKEEESRTNG
jgi:hypothetical protein